MLYLGIAVLTIYGGTVAAVAAVSLPAIFIPSYRKALGRILAG